MNLKEIKKKMREWEKGLQIWVKLSSGAVVVGYKATVVEKKIFGKKSVELDLESRRFRPDNQSRSRFGLGGFRPDIKDIDQIVFFTEGQAAGLMNFFLDWSIDMIQKEKQTFGGIIDSIHSTGPGSD